MAALVVSVIAAYLATFRNLFAVGVVESELTHRVFALPVFLVLLWHSRDSLQWPEARPRIAGLVLLCAAGTLWMLGELMLIRAFSEIAVLLMIPSAVLAVFGWEWLKALMFPLFFLMFAVPLRGPLVDWQVALTADFVHLALRGTGIPVHRDGAFFELPGRSWSVADECSGVEYLSACLMFSALFAWMMYAGTRKRLVFLAGAVLIGLAGNWLRAYLTIALAHASGNRLFAHGHGTFGWLLFAAILFLFCWAGWRFRDSIVAPARAHASATSGFGPFSWRGTRASAWIVAGTVFLILAWPALIKLATPAEASALPSFVAPSLPPPWVPAEASRCPWRPQMKNPVWTESACYASTAAGSAPATAQLFVAAFANQNWNSKLVSSIHGLAPEGWSLVKRESVSMNLGEQPVTGRAFVVRRAGERFRVWQWYAVDGQYAGSDIRAKLLQLRSRLAGKPDVSFWLAAATPVVSDVDAADRVLQEFVLMGGNAIRTSIFR
ncbi:MAG: EpsI family protein [Betaproteobacteria bacterium]|nr:EpsI family protein [Betaproteobacteria bacterium]